MMISPLENDDSSLVNDDSSLENDDFCDRAQARGGEVPEGELGAAGAIFD